MPPKVKKRNGSLLISHKQAHNYKPVEIGLIHLCYRLNLSLLSVAGKLATFLAHRFGEILYR
jgi:hypothetical protein